ncbi:MAG: hypothetical protein HQM08_07510 [Candidatus Riflebacteria bacterium]|nr:hypothetical protein [Candidatus Riflebacteria bacterium]
MFKKSSLVFFSLGLIFLFLLQPGWGAQDVGKALEEAMKLRETDNVEEVTKLFQYAVEQTTNPHQKASILSLLADFLMEKQEWEKANEVNKRILIEGPDIFKPVAYYESAQAFLMLNQPEKAKAICQELKAKFPDNSMEDFANYMKTINSESVHAKLASFLKETPSQKLEQTILISEPTHPKSVESILETATSEEKLLKPLLDQEVYATGEQACRKQKKESRFAIGAQGWHTNLSGNIHAKGMDLDFGNETNIGEQTSLTLNGTWKLSEKDQLRFNYTHFDHNGTIGKMVTFNQLLFNSGASIDGNTRFFDLGFSRLLNGKECCSWKFLYGVEFSRMFVRLAQPMPAGTRAAELTTNFEIPYLGIEGNTKLSKNLKLNGSVKLSAINQSNTEAKLADLEMSFLFGRDYTQEPGEFEWYGLLGYRLFKLHGEIENDTANIRYSGPIFGIEIKF